VTAHRASDGTSPASTDGTPVGCERVSPASPSYIRRQRAAEFLAFDLTNRAKARAKRTVHWSVYVYAALLVEDRMLPSGGKRHDDRRLRVRRPVHNRQRRFTECEIAVPF